MPEIPPPSSPPGSARLPCAVWLLSFVSFFADESSEMVYPLLPLFLVGVLGSSKTQLGAMEGRGMVALLDRFLSFRLPLFGRRGTSRVIGQRTSDAVRPRNSVARLNATFMESGHPAPLYCV